MSTLSEVSFEGLNLSPETLRAVRDMGFNRPTHVQVAAFTPVIEGHDIMVQSHTGSGKTVAYGMPLAEMLNPLDRQVQALILLPTRELANQVSEELSKLFAHRALSVAAVYGGAGMGGQIAELKSGVQVVAGTPGRLLDHLRRKTLSLSGLRILVLDEADEMLSMGFAKDLDAILEYLPKERQSLLFSATIPEDIKELCQRFLHNPEFVSLSNKATPREVTHYCYMISGLAKQRDLVKLLKHTEPEDAIIFCNTREDTHFIATYLRRQGFDAEEISGDLPQSEREIVMNKIKRKELRFLVATDVAARGIDISELSHVINYSIPEYHEVYIHRTGRTGRAGRSGTAISLVAPQELGNFMMIRKIYKLETIEKQLPTDAELVEATAKHVETAAKNAEAAAEAAAKAAAEAAAKAAAAKAKAAEEAAKNAEAAARAAEAAAKAAEEAAAKRLEDLTAMLGSINANPEQSEIAKRLLASPDALQKIAALIAHTETNKVPRSEDPAKTKNAASAEAKAEAQPETRSERPDRRDPRARHEEQRARNNDTEEAKARPEPKVIPPLPTLANETWGEPLDILLSPKELRSKHPEPRSEQRAKGDTEENKARPERSERAERGERNERREPRAPRHEEPARAKAPEPKPEAPENLATIEIAALPIAEEAPSLPAQEDATQPILERASLAEISLDTTAENHPETDADEAEGEGEGEDIDNAKMTRLYLNLGRRDHVRASELTRFLREHVKLTRRDLGRVQVRDTFSHVGIRLDLAEQLVKALHGQKYKNKTIVAELAKSQRANKNQGTEAPNTEATQESTEAPQTINAEATPAPTETPSAPLEAQPEATEKTNGEATQATHPPEAQPEAQPEARPETPAQPSENQPENQ